MALLISVCIRFAALVLLVSPVLAGRNPCHPAKWKGKIGVTCQKAVLPPNLCAKCKLRPFQPNGAFTDCTAIYDIDDPECQAELITYANLNDHCDPVRPRQVMDFSNQENRHGLDYFVYSVCEECCDCVPIGATIAEYDTRAAAGTLLNVNRGNCPAHAFYDLKNVWPQLKYVTGAGLPDLTGAPTIGPLLQAWINSPASNNWLQNNNAVIDPAIEAFLSLYMDAAVCSNRDVWESCAALETAQNRL